MKNPSLQKKSAARLRAVQYIYQYLLRGREITPDALLARENDEPDDNQEDDNESLPIAPDEKLLRGIVHGTIMQEAEIAAQMVRALPTHWAEEKMIPLYRAILLAAGYEFLYHPKLATRILLDEYVNLAGDFCDEQETALLNGLLQEAAKQLRPLAAANG